MKLIYTVAILFGVIASIHSACDITGCTAVTSCDQYTSYKKCLEDLLPDCTTSALDVIAKGLIDTAIAATEVAIAQCGATSVSVSIVTMVLAAAAAFFQS